MIPKTVIFFMETCMIAHYLKDMELTIDYVIKFLIKRFYFVT